MLNRFANGIEGVPGAQNWQQIYNSIPTLIKQDQLDGLGAYKQRRTEEDTIVKRNNNIVRSFVDAGEGARVMIVGEAHITATDSGENNLVKLLENQGIPVVVLKA